MPTVVKEQQIPELYIAPDAAAKTISVAVNTKNNPTLERQLQDFVHAVVYAEKGHTVGATLPKLRVKGPSYNIRSPYMPESMPGPTQVTVTAHSDEEFKNYVNALTQENFAAFVAKKAVPAR